MLVSGLFFALSICIAKRVVARYGAMVLMGFSSLFGSLVLLPLALARTWGTGLESLAAAWVPVLYVALAGTALAYFLYYFGLVNTPVQLGSMTFFLKPVLASLLAVLIIGEKVNAFMVTGTGLILAGLVLVIAKRRPEGKA